MKNFSQLRIIFYALAMGQFLFAAVVYYVTNTQSEFTDMPIFAILAPVAVLGAGAMSYFLNQQLQLKELEEKDEDTRFGMFRRRVIARLAILEGGNLLAVVGTLITGNLQYLLYFLLGMLIFFLMQPKVEEFEGPAVR